MSSGGRRSWEKSFPGSSELMPQQSAALQAAATPQVVGLRHKGPLLFCRSLPTPTICMLLAVWLDILVMVGYGSVLLSTGTNKAAFYFASLIFSAAVVLMYFSISAIRSENTVELLATIAIGTCVNAMVFYVRANDNALSAVQRTTVLTPGSSVFNVSPALFNAGVITAFALLQLALMWFGYLSYRDFGWRIFKLFGIDFNMRQVYERFLWFAAMLKLDAFTAVLNVAAGFAFFFQHLVGAVEHSLMIVGIVGNMVWVVLCFAAVKLEYRVTTAVLLPLGLIPAGYLLYKAYDLYNVYTAGIAADGTAYGGKYSDVWIEPIMATLAFGVVTRLALLVLMNQTRRNFGVGLRGFSMHREYALPERLRQAMAPDQAEGIKAMVRGLHLIGSLELRAPPARGDGGAAAASRAGAPATVERAERGRGGAAAGGRASSSSSSPASAAAPSAVVFGRGGASSSSRTT